jgi:hypothetical protein
MSFLLSLMMLGVDEVLRSTEQIELVQRWFIVLLIVGAVYFGRRRMLASSKGVGESITDGLTRMTPAGANWQGGSKGYDLLGIDRGAKYASWGAAATVAAAGGVVQQRLQERRAARRGFKNLERMEHTRERPRLVRRAAEPGAAPALPAPGGGGRHRASDDRPAFSANPGGGGGGRHRASDDRPAFTANPGGGGRHRASNDRPAFGTNPGGGRHRASDDRPTFTANPGGGSGGAGWQNQPSAPPAPAPAERPPRYEVDHGFRAAPYGGLRHPIKYARSRVRNGMPVTGTRAQADRMERRAGRINRRRDHGWS